MEGGHALLLTVPFVWVWFLGYFGFNIIFSIIISLCVFACRFISLRYEANHVVLQKLLNIIHLDQSIVSKKIDLTSADFGILFSKNTTFFQDFLKFCFLNSIIKNFSKY